MLDRREIMTKAWSLYRLARPAFFAKGDTADKRMFLGHLFARFLRQSWADAHKAASAAKRAAEAEQALAQSIVNRLQQDRVAFLTSLSAAERSARLSAIADELRALEYAPWGVNTRQRREALNAEIEALEAADYAVAVSPAPSPSLAA